MACSYLNFSSHTENTSKQQKLVAFCEELLSENDFEAVLVISVVRQFKRLVQGHCWSYANSLKQQIL